MHQLLRADHKAETGLWTGKDWSTLPNFGIRWRCIMQSPGLEPFAVVQKQMAKPGITNPQCIFQHGLEYRLQFTRRTADDAEHLRSGRLLFQRLREVARARLHLVEQPHVLDRDH